MSGRGTYGLAVTIDIPMDLLSGPFDEQSLEQLFLLYRRLGIRRIDWLDIGGLSEGYLDYWMYDHARQNAVETRKAIGEFLPAAVRIAHKLDMQCFAVFKTFDRAFNYCAYRRTPGRPGLTDIIGGEVARVTCSFLALKHCRMERNMRLLPKDCERMTIAKIRLESSGDGNHGLTEKNLRLQVSPDNDVYRPYRGPMRYAEKTMRGKRVIELSGLRIRERYVALLTPFREGEGHFSNTLDRLVRLYDAGGREIPFTYGLQSNEDRFRNFTTRRRHLRVKLAPNVWTSGYCFDASGESITDGFLKRTERALDGAPGYLALAKGKARYTVALSPSYPAARELWLSQIRRCLKAGVDGVDIRIDNHARSHEWEAYGFEEPVAAAYRDRWGVDPRYEKFKASRLLDVRAVHFTDFMREASREVRQHGRKFHAHILGFLMRRTLGQRYMGMKWEWETWIREGLLDGLTMKGLSPEWPEDGARLCRRLEREAARAGVPIWYCINFNVLARFPDWPKRFARISRYSRDSGHAGMILYESAELSRRQRGTFRLRHTELPNLLSKLTARSKGSTRAR